MSGKYDDIIGLPHPVSSRHAPMSALDRAAQFSPFAALTGYDAAIAETARLTDCAADLDECRLEELNGKLQIIQEQPNRQVTVTYFAPDARKSGGSYRSSTGKVKKVDGYSRVLVMEDGQVIGIDSIFEIMV